MRPKGETWQLQKLTSHRQEDSNQSGAALLVHKHNTAASTSSYTAMCNSVRIWPFIILAQRFVSSFSCTYNNSW